MTIRQFYYTSCKQGADGIQGFQVNAITPGVDRAQVDAGLPLSMYRPPPDAHSLPTPEQLREFPVALGYRRYNGYSLLFHSRYLGADFTGRQGNYFAHVLVLDGPDAEFRNALPIDSWGADRWTWRLASGPQLPTLPDIPTGALRASAPGHYIRSGQFPEFAVVLSAVQDSLSKNGSRIIIVSQSDDEVARAIDAVTRSLPPDLALKVSFNTYSAAPNNADVLVVGTTPDVTISASPFAQQTVLRIGEPAAGSASAARVSRFARVMMDCWMRGDSEALEAVSLASTVSPPIQPSELDDLSFLLELAVSKAPWTISGFELLPALEFALERSPATLRPQVWAKVDKLIEREKSALDIRRWSAVLAAAHARNMKALPPALDSRYLTAVLSAAVAGQLDPTTVWLPSHVERRQEDAVLDWADAALVSSPGGLAEAAAVVGALGKLGVALPDSTLRRLAEQVVLPQLIDPATSTTAASELAGLPAANRVLPVVTQLLEGKILADELFDAVVQELSVAAAQLLSPYAPRGSRCVIAFTIVQARARARGFNPVDVLAQVTRGGDATPASVDRYADLLWPEPPPAAAEAVAICRAIRPQLLGSSRLLSTMVDRLIADARSNPGLGNDDVALANELMKPGLYESLHESQMTVWCVQAGDFFGTDRAFSSSVKKHAVSAVQIAARVATEIGDWVLDAVADWMLRLGDAIHHVDVLSAVLKAGGNPKFLTVYRRLLAVMLRKADADLIAAVLPALAYLGTWDREVQKLLTTTCAENLNGRRKKDLAAIGESLDRTDRNLRPLLKPMKGNAPPSWPEWWLAWQEAHIDRSLTGRLFGRRRIGKAAD